MKDWGVYVTDNPESGKWTHYKTIAKADLFDWATGDGAYAGQVVVDDAGTADTADDWFYYYVPVKDKNAAAGADPFSIGVAKIKKPPRTMGRRHRSAVADYHADANRNHRSRILRGQ